MEIIIKILLIDEEYAEYLLVGDLLSHVFHTKYQLSWCECLDRGLDEALSDRYDAILLDYHWGTTTSHDLLAAARAKGCKIPILVMTDEMEADLDREVIRAGASDYLIKGRVDSVFLDRTIRYAIERKTVELKLSKLAHYDILTDVPNRILFRDRLEHALQLAERGHMSFTLMYLDLDGFKQVNDSFGHDAGDELIRLCAERLCTCMRRSDSVARIGGDEFTLLLERTESTTDIAHVAEKILEAVTRPYQIDHHQVEISCSLGIAVYPDAGRDAESLQKHADMAMYQAKQQEGSAYQFFTEVMNVEVHKQLKLEIELRRAIRCEEFKLYYQPRFNIDSGEIVGLEALLRWNHPRRGLVEPDEFLFMVEDTGMIVSLGYWVIQRACEDFKKILRSGDAPYLLAINLSPRQFNDEQLVSRVASILKETGIKGANIEFGLNETAVAENTESVSLFLHALSALGPRFSMDDFGTGHSSFVHLQKLPISTLKIDRKVVRTIVDNADDRTLVKAIISLAHNLNKEVVALGIESKQQLDILQAFGCDQAQGFHLGRPLDFCALSKMLAVDRVPITDL